MVGTGLVELGAGVVELIVVRVGMVELVLMGGSQ